MKNSTLKIVLIILLIEKIFQHFISAILFLFDLEIGKPEIGPNFNLSNETMALFNIILVPFFIWALISVFQKENIGFSLSIFLGFFDIIAEILFHGIGYFTLSVLIAGFIIYISAKLKNHSEIKES